MQTNLQRPGVGVQEPRVLLLPGEFDQQQSADRAADMIDVASIAGVTLDPWQKIGAESITLTRADGRWAAFEAFLAANRQQGKGTIIEARQLAGLFVWEETLQVYTAHEFKTAQEMFLRIRQLVESTPTLDRMVQRIRTADGEEAIETKSGCRLKFMARSNSSGRGFTAPTLYLDEAMKLKRRMVASLMPTMSALSLNGNPQLLYFSSAGEADSEVQEDVRDRALRGDSKRLVYVEWSVPRWDELPPLEAARWSGPEEYRADPEVHRRANPGYGIRLDPDFVAKTELEGMGPEEFDRERLGIWEKLGGESVINPTHWAAGLDESVPALPAVAFAVDVPPSRDKADIVMVGFREDGEPFAELVERRFGTSWVPSRLAELNLKHSPVAIVIDAASGAGALLPEIKRAGVRTLQLSPREYFQACGQVFDLISQGKLHHPGQDELNEAVDAAQQKVLGGGLWKWTRGNDTLRDISPLVAITLAWHGLSKRGRIERTKRRAVIL